MLSTVELAKAAIDDLAIIASEETIAHLNWLLEELQRERQRADILDQTVKDFNAALGMLGQETGDSFMLAENMKICLYQVRKQRGAVK